MKPKGWTCPGSARLCPLSRYLSRCTDVRGDTMRVGPWSAYWSDGGVEDCMAELPLRLQMFIKRFDDGKYPSLIAAEWREVHDG